MGKRKNRHHEISQSANKEDVFSLVLSKVKYIIQIAKIPEQKYWINFKYSIITQHPSSPKGWLNCVIKKIYLSDASAETLWQYDIWILETGLTFLPRAVNVSHPKLGLPSTFPDTGN